MTVYDVISVAGSGTHIKVIQNVNSLQETIEGKASDFIHDKKNWEPMLDSQVLCLNTGADDGYTTLEIHASGLVLGVKGRIRQ